MTHGRRVGKILRIDLGSRTVSPDVIPDEQYRRLFGGRGLIAHALLQETKQGLDPLGPENLLVFAAGPITGAPLSGTGRHGVGAKSPLAGGIASSEAGGYWGAELKRAGIDAVYVSGRAAEPVWLWIHDGTAEIRDAAPIWGKTTGEADAWLRSTLNDSKVRTSLIGPAGERLVRYANVVTDLSHFAGRGGLGAVMGSKQLKGVVVRAPGDSAGSTVADPDAVRAISKWMASNLSIVDHLHDSGTAAAILPQAYMGGLPSFNFREGQFAEAEAISGESMRDTILVGRGTCFACSVRCKRVVETDAPFSASRVYGGPEYETIAGFGSNSGISDLKAIAHANALCAANGLDTISASGVIAFAMECYESGILTRADTDGLELRFGDANASILLLQKIIGREGVGDSLAEGVARAAALIGKGAEGFALHVKGQELPLHEPRMKPGMGLGYAISPTGADHEHNMHDDDFVQESLHLRRAREFGDFGPLDVRDLGDQKVRLLAVYSNWQHLMDCLVMCRFLPYDVPQVVEIVRAVTGWDIDKWELLNIGKRAAMMARLFNVREGLKAGDDKLPKRFSEAIRTGPLAGVSLDPDIFGKALSQYYREIGWDAEGKPTQQALDDLEIGYLGGP
jgi:aldehyde:ferredoxin oxidoreductase